MTRILRFGLLVGVALLTACSTGADFALPTPGSFRLGKTTPAEVIGKLGEPTQRSTSTTPASATRAATEVSIFTPAPASGRYENFTYFGGDRMAINADGVVAELMRHGVRRTRMFSCTFFDGQLISYLGSSSFDADRTDFDDAKVDSLVRGKTTGDEVLKLFGKPSGGAIYPMLSRRDGAALTYFYEEDNVDSGRHVKLLQIFVDESGIVRDYRSASTTLPNDYAPSAEMPIPIFVPGKQ